MGAQSGGIFRAGKQSPLKIHIFSSTVFDPTLVPFNSAPYSVEGFSFLL